MSMFDIFKVSGSALNAQSQRLNAVASNLANADSATSATGEPYRAKQVVFSAKPVDESGATGVQVSLQLWVPDAAGLLGSSSSNGVVLTTP